ncbi:SAM-dependent methyltransferase [Streptomyces sp. URMC 126]|uniref:SAM-dependent methyltransferase n=1 Tax=Streptomyces sp. URMC 126 TaxID=3423401 RepID=UPI003F1C663D
MTVNRPPVVTARRVGRLYDVLAGLGHAVMGDSLHLGYWRPGQDVADTPFGRAADQLTDLVTERLGLAPGDRALDLGCGIGGPAVRLHRTTGAVVVGVTVSEEEVRRAEAAVLASSLDHRIEIRWADAAALRFPDASFDAVMAIDSLLHMPDRPRVLMELARVLRPGRRLVLTDFFDRRQPGDARGETPRACRQRFLAAPAPSGEEYARTVAEAGFLVEEVLDISDNCLSQTVRALSARIAEERTALYRRFGSVLVDAVDPAPLGTASGVGYLLLTAVRSVG